MQDHVGSRTAREQGRDRIEDPRPAQSRNTGQFVQRSTDLCRIDIHAPDDLQGGVRGGELERLDADGTETELDNFDAGHEMRKGRWMVAVEPRAEQRNPLDARPVAMPTLAIPRGCRTQWRR